MHQIQITRTVKRTYQNGKYLVKIKPDRFMEILSVYLRQPHNRIFKWKEVADYLFPVVCYHAERQGINLEADDALVRIGKFAIQTYENDARRRLLYDIDSKRQLNRFDSGV